MNDTNSNEAINRQLKVLEQKLEGKSFRAIGKALKISHATAKRDYEQAVQEAYQYNQEEINAQRNKAQLMLDRIMGSLSKKAFGYRKVNRNLIGGRQRWIESDHNTEHLWVDIKTQQPVKEHEYMDSHFDDETEEWICEGKTCTYIERKLSKKELQEAKDIWEYENTTWIEPDPESIKLLLESIKVMDKVWGFNGGSPTLFDQRKQTIQIGDSSNE